MKALYLSSLILAATACGVKKPPTPIYSMAPFAEPAGASPSPTATPAPAATPKPSAKPRRR